jgi:hypothetical protein
MEEVGLISMEVLSGVSDLADNLYISAISAKNISEPLSIITK